MTDKLTTFDSLFDKIGHIGRYQVLLYILVGYAALPSGFHAVASVFLQASTDYHCAVPNGTTLPPKYNDRCNTTDVDTCSQYADTKQNTTIPCTNGYWYDTSVFQSTVVSEFDLVCENKMQNTLIKALYFVGFFFGAAAGGYISDNYGRRLAIIVGQTGLFSSSIAASFAVNWWMYAIFRTLCGLFANISYVSCFVFVMEVIGPNGRTPCGIWIQGIFAVGYGLLSVFGTLIRTWNWFQFAISFVSIPDIVFMILLFDSPRWLLMKGRTEEARKILMKIGKGNNRDVEFLEKADLQKTVETGEEKEGDVDRKYSMLDLFRHGRTMQLITLNCCFNWFVNSVTYYGLSLNSASLPGSIYFTNAMNALIEFPSYLVAGYILDKQYFGRRNSVAGFLLLGGVCTLLSTVFGELAFCNKDDFSDPYVIAGFVCALLGKFGISGSFAIIYNFTAELFPTPVRGIAVGTCSMISRLGGILSPVFLSLYEVVSWLPGLIFGATAIAAGVLSFYLPETRDVPMLMTFEDANNLYKGREVNTKKYEVQNQSYYDDDENSTKL